MVRVAGVVCLIVLLGVGVSRKADARNLSALAAREGESSWQCPATTRLLTIHAMDIANRISPVALDGESATYRAARFTPGVRGGMDGMPFVSTKGSLMDQVNGNDYAAASFNDLSGNRGAPVAAIVLARGESNGQMLYNTPQRQGVEPFPEQTDLVLFGAGMLLIALLVRRRSVEKTAEDREHVRASNPPLPVERS